MIKQRYHLHIMVGGAIGLLFFLSLSRLGLQDLWAILIGGLIASYAGWKKERIDQIADFWDWAWTSIAGFSFPVLFLVFEHFFIQFFGM